MAQAGYWRTGSLEEALAVLARHRPRVLAGGTDLFATPQSPSAPEGWLDLGGLEALKGWRDDAGPDGACLRLGALTPWSAIVRGGFPAWGRALVQAAREIGGVQIQNRGTVGGNLCHASPAADGVPALIALDARVELCRQGGSREIALADFVLGPRRTDRRPDELLTAIVLPSPAPGARSSFVKLGHRRYLVIAIASVAMSLSLGGDSRVRRVRVAVGACGPRASRLATLEQRLTGLAAPLDPDTVWRCADADALAALTPIDDVRGTADHRRDAVRHLLSRGLAELSREALA